MALAQYGTLITTIGLAQIANAQITQSKVGLEYIALGDGNGAHYVPTQNQTALVHEVWRGPIAELSIDPTNSNRIIIDAVIPVTAGGFTIREIGIFDDKNQLIAIGQYPEKYKPQLSEGVSEETLIHFVIETNNADVVKLNIDPTVIIASRKYVDAKVADAVGNIDTDLTKLKTEVTTHKDDFELHTPYVVSTGTSTLYEVNLGSSVIALKEGMSFAVKIHETNTDFAELNVNGLGKKYLINDQKSLLPSGVLQKNSIYTVRFSGEYFIIQGGGVKLNNSLISTSTTEAATANAVKMVNDKLNPVSVSVPASAGWQAVSFNAKVILGICYVVGDLTLTTANSRTLGVLPVGFRPSLLTYTSIFGSRSGTNQFTTIDVSHTGAMSVTNIPELGNLSVGTRYTFSFSFPIS